VAPRYQRGGGRAIASNRRQYETAQRKVDSANALTMARNSAQALTSIVNGGKAVEDNRRCYSNGAIATMSKRATALGGRACAPFSARGAL